MLVKPCTITEIQHLIAEYLGELSSPFDSFLEEHILSSTFFLFQDDSNDVGYMAVHNNELLTQFYIRRQYLRHAQQLFQQAIERHAIKALFVPTCDELLISLVMDQDYAINKQAYFFQDSQVQFSLGDVRENEEFRLATQTDLATIQQVCGDFMSDYEHRVERGELFVYYRKESLLGIGLVERSNMFERLASIGMFTNEAYRKQGVGKMLILHLRKWCSEHGISPIAGCWYYNDPSKRTLESAGMVTKTRLLHVEVNQPKPSV